MCISKLLQVSANKPFNIGIHKAHRQTAEAQNWNREGGRANGSCNWSQRHRDPSRFMQRAEAHNRQQQLRFGRSENSVSGTLPKLFQCDAGQQLENQVHLVKPTQNA